MSTHGRSLAMGVVAAAFVVVALSAHAITGPSSSASPYVLRARPGVVTKAILTVGDSVGGSGWGRRRAAPRLVFLA